MIYFLKAFSWFSKINPKRRWKISIIFISTRTQIPPLRITCPLLRFHPQFTNAKSKGSQWAKEWYEKKANLDSLNVLLENSLPTQQTYDINLSKTALCSLLCRKIKYGLYQGKVRALIEFEIRMRAAGFESLFYSNLPGILEYLQPAEKEWSKLIASFIS